ncbi:Fumarate hydratase class I, aerobic [Atribacter laminatus]|uniref:Fumarate hydratase class I, aerobic n=2 Tax=Atribacter laminatus TaxID=2847778 RepID=A0A7T1F2C8_ATRLM|nr:Fumarate hydratase class I, aerobic [Atribacter laminatus]
MIEMKNVNEYILKTPLSIDDVLILHSGDKVLLNGEIYCARDATHRRMIADIKSGSELPFSLMNSTFYYAGPSPTPPGKVVGSVGPTTSSRMDQFLEYFLQRGLRSTIGKGERSSGIKKLLEKYNSVYFITCGGAAAYLSSFVVRSDLLGYEDLGAQALIRLWVRDLPLLVAYDSYGGDLFESGKIHHRRVNLIDWGSELSL